AGIDDVGRGADRDRKEHPVNTTHIHLGLARNSDWAFTSAVVIMVVALLLLAVELAYTRSRKTDRELVGVGADSATPGVVADAPRPPGGQPAGGGRRFL